MGNSRDTPPRASRAIEHPGRDLQPPIRCVAREAAAENRRTMLLNHLMNVDLATCPRMPWIEKLVMIGPVGVPSSCCTTRSDPIPGSAAGRRPRSPRKGSRGMPRLPLQFLQSWSIKPRDSTP